MILRASSEQDGKTALAELCRRYWYPLYSYARRKGNGVEDAEDLTQAFFAKLLSGTGLDDVSPKRGKFRAFLLAGINHFMIDEWRKSDTKKRGADFDLLSIDTQWAEGRLEKEPQNSCDPEAFFDRGWALTLVDRVMAELEREYQHSKKAGLFDLLRTCLTGGNEKSYAELADEAGMSEGGFTMAVHRLRRKFGEMIRDEVKDTLDDDEDIDTEVRWLLLILGKTL